ncbi:uncharacterized protein [Dermacentor andersoni]|uniref:uncharacterized protein isoform X9 n=1 Tax=Dermacentor andersoni TaxID=34620 RepID=UPI0024174A5D|nr:protein tramtrack, beta isoform-like isoform X9 [Dermacentor andersoni]
MGSQQFCLKWNNHQSNMLAVFEQLLSNEALVDVTLACEGLSLKAHKMVLSACSPFFQALFVENPCKHPIVIMKDMRYMDLKAIVEFMYRGEVNVSQDQLSALLKTAETLKVKGLAEVTGENKHGALVSVDGADPKPVGTPRAESPPLSKRKRGRPRRRSPSDSNKSDSEDQGGPPATRIKGPESPEIIEDGSLSSDRVTALPAASPSSRTSSTVAVSSTAVPPSAHLGSTAKATNSLATSQHTQDSIGDDVGEGDDADFEVEPSNLMEQSMTTENVPVFTDVASSSQALGNESQQSHHTGSTSDSTALVPVQASLPSDISISSQVDIKPSPSSLIPYDDQAISPVVAAPPAAAASSAEGASMAMMFMDSSGVPAIAGPSNYHPDKQQSTPSHGNPKNSSAANTSYPTGLVWGTVPPQSRAMAAASSSSCRNSADWTAPGPPARKAGPFCRTCNRTFSTRGSLNRHMEMHQPFRVKHACHLCFKEFAWPSDLTTHLRISHGSPHTRRVGRLSYTKAKLPPS